MRSHCPPLAAAGVLLGLAVGLLVSLPASAQPTLIELLLEGDAVAGVGNVTTIDNLAVNEAGEWLVEADTDFADTNQDGVLIRSGSLYLREDNALIEPPGAHLDTFDSINLNNAGHSGWNFFLSGTSGTTDDSGIYFDTLLVIQESDISTAPQFSPNTPYIGFFDAKINRLNQMLLVASIDDPAIASTVDRALVRLDVGSGGILVAETVIAKEGDILPGQVDAVADFGTGPHESAFIDDGRAFYFADLAGLTTTDGCIYFELALVAQEGSPSVVALRNYETLSGRGLDANNVGQYVFKANLDGATTDDEIIVKDASAFVREGDNLPAIGTFLLTGFGTSSGPVLIDDGGRVLWFGDWDDPDTNVDTGLFFQDTLLVQEGVTEIGGVIVDEIANGADAFAMSDDGRYIIFEATLVGGVSGAFLIDRGGPVSVGEAMVSTGAFLQAAPNPFHTRTALRYALPSETAVTLEIFDAGGRSVAVLAQGVRPAGQQTAFWDGFDAGGRPVAGGVYFARLRAGQLTVEEKIVRGR